MTSVCNSGRQQKGVGDDVDADNAGFNLTSFLSVTYEESANETSTYENVSSIRDVSTTVEDAILEDSHQASKNRLQRRCQRLATLSTSVQPEHGRTSEKKYHLNVEEAHYCCTFCDKYFTQKQLLRHHMKLHTANMGREMSDLLDKKSKETGEVQKYEALTKVSYVCETCDMDCKYKSVYIQHQKIHKNKEKTFLSCHICRKEFKFNSLLLHHMESHKLKSKVKKSLSCHTCGKKYTKSGSLTKHELQHEGKGSFRCRPCGDVFATEAERTKHRDEKHEKPWKCAICNHTFATEDKLDSHMKWHENKETEVFICNVCDKEFKLKVNLKVHVESRCGTDPQHVCNVCGKAFMTRGTLVTHSLLHTGEKTFLCRFCGKNFRLKVEMQRHERSHTGEKPFVCKVCNKAFAHRESLVTHNTLHTGIRPYMCEACGSTFSCIGNLIKHRKTHRNRCALVTPTMTSSKCRVKSTTRKLQTHEKNVTARKSPVEHLMNSMLLGVQRPSNNGVTEEEAPLLPGSCYNYRNSNYEENRDWISPMLSSSDQTIERIPAINDRFHPIADLHLGSMEQNIKSTHYYWGSGNIMGMHPDAIQSFGVYSAISKESKPESATRSLPYTCSTDGLIVNNGKPTVGSIFQNSDNHRLQNYGAEKYSHDNRIQISDREKYSYSQKETTDPFKHNNVKSSYHVGQNTITIQKESGYESNFVCGNRICQTATLVNGPENHSSDDIPSENDVYMTDNFTAKNSISNLKYEDTDNKHKDNLPGSILESESQETDELSAVGSPVNISSDSTLSEQEQTDIFTSKVLVDCNYTVKKEIELDVKDGKDVGKSVFKSGVMSSLKKIPHERKQKYPARCDVRSKESDTASVTKSTSEFPEDQFSCASCGLGFAQEQLLNEHTRSHSDNSNKYNEINTDDSERTDLASDEDEPLYKRLERHLKEVEILNSGEVPRKFLCQYCNKYFEFVSQLNRHRKCHSSEEKGATPCRHCGKKYTNRACLIKHESQHTGAGVFKCRQCGDGFNSKREYRSHRTKQHGKQWSCSDCQRSFSNSSNLKNHYNNKHLGREAKSYACNICGKLFKQKGNLKVHVDSRCGSEPRHVCNVCGKAFMSGGSLGTHILLHTGEKTFLCRFCGKSYRLKVEMQRHERSHTGEKPFVCKVCNKAFAHRESLVTHNTLHTGIRPYMCEACGATFSCIGNLIKHRQTHNRRCDIARV
ncbi:zinc finger protein 850-like [Zootermopsis nevadensis]|uniref:Histone-lysine N-methyltransferase PRDM9 n=1 Tax=Zootermopsis nevadensis TaxID=136037 RepID=A0A067RJ35_ZOONE|nr:zinc finger protein 850-like [Zootermopsis nevadensis]XP_021942402.1 zinc finger protein 850-like [Zootermopsis nevadensis]XP_021942403.1 zinc finger protein 850-like [Zootermopsis nevadensis]KDR23033.1 Histone-lysine N-methyltransferase PRDM9 [Zootermopsis nevadensis]